MKQAAKRVTGLLAACALLVALVPGTIWAAGESETGPGAGTNETQSDSLPAGAAVGENSENLPEGEPSGPEEANEDTPGAGESGAPEQAGTPAGPRETQSEPPPESGTEPAPPEPQEAEQQAPAGRAMARAESIINLDEIAGAGTGSGTGWGFDGASLTISAGAHTLVGDNTFEGHVVIDGDNVTLTLQNVEIHNSVGLSAIHIPSGVNTTTLLLEGGNWLEGSAGIDLQGQSLRIQGSGSLDVTGTDGPAIDCPDKTVEISGGAKVTAATNRQNAAAIGGNVGHGGGGITVSGAGTVVRASGGAGAADIGAGGSNVFGGNLTVTDGAAVHLQSSGLKNDRGVMPATTLQNATLYYGADDGLALRYGDAADVPEEITINVGDITLGDDFGYIGYADRNTYGFIDILADLPAGAKTTLTGTTTKNRVGVHANNASLTLQNVEIHYQGGGVALYINSSANTTTLLLEGGNRLEGSAGILLLGQNLRIQGTGSLEVTGTAFPAIECPGTTVEISGGAQVTAATKELNVAAIGGTGSSQSGGHVTVTGAGTVVRASGGADAVDIGADGSAPGGSLTVTDGAAVILENGRSNVADEDLVLGECTISSTNGSWQHDGVYHFLQVQGTGASASLGRTAFPAYWQQSSQGQIVRAGETVALTATPQPGMYAEWQFGGTPVQDWNKQAATFTMPEGGVTVAAQFSPLVHAATPAITSQPQAWQGTVGGTAQLAVTATITDNGALTYQWYSAEDAAGTNPQPIAGAQDDSFTPPTGAVGTFYYFVQVTNTNTDASITGSQTVSANSNAVAVVVTAAELPALTLTGLPEGNTMRVGQSITLTPSEGGQTGGAGWAYDSAYFSASFNSPATFTALQEGTSTITYTAADGRSVSVAITVLAAEGPGTQAGETPAVAATGDGAQPWLYTALAALAVLGAASLLWLKKRRAEQ